MMNLMQENEENRKRMALSVITVAITVIAVGALVVIAAYMNLPAVARVLLIVGAVFVAAAGIAAGAMLDRRAGYFECPHCKELFVPSMDAVYKKLSYFYKTQVNLPEMRSNGNVQTSCYEIKRLSGNRQYGRADKDQRCILCAAIDSPPAFADRTKKGAAAKNAAAPNFVQRGKCKRL